MILSTDGPSPALKEDGPVSPVPWGFRVDLPPDLPPPADEEPPSLGLASGLLSSLSSEAETETEERVREAQPGPSPPRGPCPSWETAALQAHEQSVPIPSALSSLTAWVPPQGPQLQGCPSPLCTSACRLLPHGQDVGHPSLVSHGALDPRFRQGWAALLQLQTGYLSPWPLTTGVASLV